ncbi:LysR substrate-binding domain-containing protein [Gleimia hominis]|uniref:Probable hydrogen peroxide-inducible genes activator n=1 Tax=Gleimia hominis TaxID=595468 RepID=A0ABU3IBL4_9ACTO|nr:LysR substrate-binding domain-containing protein [Gleimia hominis]MDT3767770.1 LysR substrate-binding domain-containing protein [Gleimia hominis]
MNLRDLEYLVALADEGTFTRAAAAAGASQPTLSTQVRKLESDLGAALVERCGSQILFTPVGREVVAYARHVLSDLTHIRDAADRGADPWAARISLGIFPTLAPYLLPHLLPRLNKSMPNARLQFVEDKTLTLLDQLAAGGLDAVIVADPVEDPRYSSAYLFGENLVLAVPDSHRLAGQDEPVSLEELRGETILLLEEGNCLRNHSWAPCQHVGARQAQFAATSLETLRYMVASGAGVTLLPELSVKPPFIQPDSLHLIRFKDPQPSRRLRLVWRSSSPLEPVIHQIAEDIKQVSVNTV